MIKYPKTQQFRNIIQEVKHKHDFKDVDDFGQPVFRHSTPYPTITFDATVKLHGTNAAIVFHNDGSQTYQSRERELSLEYDNAGFMQAMSSKDLHWLRTQKDIAEEESDVLINSQLELKDVSKQISLKAREFFFNKMNNV